VERRGHHHAPFLPRGKIEIPSQGTRSVWKRVLNSRRGRQLAASQPAQERPLVEGRSPAG
jgi:hypothetical protein